MIENEKEKIAIGDEIAIRGIVIKIINEKTKPHGIAFEYIQDEIFYEVELNDKRFMIPKRRIIVPDYITSKIIKDA